MPKVNQLNQVGIFENRDTAARALNQTGDVALVHRGIARMLLIRCPCGCGDNLLINLDSRAGPAWRLYERGESLTLYPSYWRDSACGSHFILWRNHVHWCTWDRDDEFWSSVSEIQSLVQANLPDHFVSYHVIADAIGEIPWDVLHACHSLVRRGIAEANVGKLRGQFRRKQTL